MAPGRREDFARVLRAALPEGETWRGAVHLWSLDAAATTQPDALLPAQEHVGASARLLWGRIRSWLLLPGLLLLLSAPELLRQTQGGDADVPLAIYLALTVLAAVGWLAERSRFALVLAFVFGAAAI